MKRIVLCFDGTSNKPEDAEQEREWLGLGKAEDNSITNILKLHLLFGGDLQGKSLFPDQLCFYYPGVGTYGSWFDKLKNMALAPPDEDVGTIIKHASKDLYKHYEKGDKVFLFGFSRGAAIARRFAAVVHDTFEALDTDIPDITFMCVFDTVAAMKHPNLFKEEIKPASDVVFENGTVSDTVKKALHILSLDDRRIAFYPTLMNKQDDVVEEIWMSGAHSDIGGGFRFDGLSDISLSYLIDYIDEHNIDIKKRPAIEINYDDLSEGSDEYISYEDVNIQPNYMGRSHEQKAKTPLYEQALSYRTPRINVKDKHSVHPPLIHHSVIERLRDMNDYNCEPLLNRMVNPYTEKKVGIRVWYGSGDIPQYATLDDALNDRRNTTELMAVGETRIVNVYANLKFNTTGIRLLAGSTIMFRVKPDQVWYDATIECGPEGWDADAEIEKRIKRWSIKLSEDFRRCPDALWFELIGCFNKDPDTNFKVLEHTIESKKYKTGDAGELYFFANDLKCKYGNNRGRMIVEVKRLE